MSNAIDIKVITKVMAALRPFLSAEMPRITLPIGRMRNAALNVAVAASNEFVGSVLGRKSFAMKTVMNEYTIKSYHSSALPITIAAIVNFDTCVCVMCLLKSYLGDLTGFNLSS